MKASLTGEPALPTSHSEALLHQGIQQPRAKDGRKHSSADVEVISPHSPQNKDAMVTFSHTLPRVHTPQAMAVYEEVARRHAAALHHASMDSSRSKQLLSQWKRKNNHKCSLQVPDAFSFSVESSSGQASQHAHHYGSMELRSSSEPSTMGLNGGYDGNVYLSTVPTGASTTRPSNSSGITGGARISMQSRPGSSQLVHIPEEARENYTTSPIMAVEENEGISTLNRTTHSNWQRAAEKTTSHSTNDNGQNTLPRIMQVISMSKQQGLLQTHSKSLDESSISCNSAVGCHSSAHHRVLTDHDPTTTTGSRSLGGTTGSISGSTGAIVRVEAHPENSKPVIHAPSSDASGSWRWRSLDHGTGFGGGTSHFLGSVGSGSLRKSFELSDVNKDSESSDSLRESSIERKHANHIVTTTANVSTPPIITVQTQSTNQSEQRLHPQGHSTIRVTPGDGSGSGSGGSGGVEAILETPCHL